MSAQAIPCQCPWCGWRFTLATPADPSKITSCMRCGGALWKGEGWWVLFTYLPGKGWVKPVSDAKGLWIGMPT